MAPSTIRKAIGAVKDQTSIGIAKVASNLAPDLEVAIVKATSHEDEPASEKHVREILTLTSSSRGYVHACVSAVSKRLGKTRDWIVALKALMLVHRVLNDGDPVFGDEIVYATRRGTRLLNLSDFRDEAHSSSWDHSAFVRTYAMYLDQRLELMLFERKSGSGGGGGIGDRQSSIGSRDNGGSSNFRSPPPRNYEYEYGGERDREFRDYENGGGMRKSRSYGDMGDSVSRNGRDEKRIVSVTPLREMKPEGIFAKMVHLQKLLDRFLAIRPTGLAKNSRLILVAVYPVVRESFQLYADICEVLAVLLDKFFDMEYADCVKALDAYASAAKQIDELVGFYGWCKDSGLARSSEYPEVQKIGSKLLETLEEFVRDRSKGTKSPERRVEVEPVAPVEEPELNMNEIKALPGPENWTPPPPPEVVVKAEVKPEVVPDLVDLRDAGVSADAQGNSLALALFAGPGGNASGNGSWEAFPSDGQPQVTSAWQTPAAEPGKADWELALVETASNLSKQQQALGGGFDPLLLDGMYDQGIVRQHVSNSQLTGGSASSVALPMSGKSATPVLALPAPDGTVMPVNQDPFAASLTVPPPSYVQMADLEKKQHLLMQEQQLWNQYAKEGMQGQGSLAKMSGAGYYGAPPMGMMPYGMPPVNGIMQPPAGYYSAPY